MRLTIDNNHVECEEGKTVLQVLKDQGINIPTLCYHPDLKAEARCRICIVEINGKLETSCNTLATEGMNIITSSQKITESRKMTAELICNKNLTNLNQDDYKEFLDVIEDIGLSDSQFKALSKKNIDKSGKGIKIDNNKCILCRRCIQKCQDVQTVYAIETINRGVFSKISPAYELPLEKIACVQCGQCSLSCPTGAISEIDDIKKVEKAIEDPIKHVIVQTAPSIRASIGEGFSLPAGTLVTGKLVTALKKLGFHKVFDTNFAADLTIMEEGSEFLEMVKKDKGFPLITSCSPGWVKFIEHFYGELLSHLSSSKSPQQMFGAIAKTYYAEKFNINPNEIFVVSAMPCTAKKFECTRPEMKSSGFKDVDVVLTARELVRFMKQKKIDLPKLKESNFDDPLGESTGAAAMFGTTGGVMEAALRTAYELATGSPVSKLEFDQIRGLDSIKKGSIIIGEKEYRFAVAHGLGNARKLMDELKKDINAYHFIEIMACPGGCIGGGGQIIPTNWEIIEKRKNAIYQEDANKETRVSHKNPEILKLYDEFLGKPLSKKAHKLLHTKYKKRSEF